MSRHHLCDAVRGLKWCVGNFGHTGPHVWADMFNRELVRIPGDDLYPIANYSMSFQSSQEALDDELWMRREMKDAWWRHDLPPGSERSWKRGIWQ